MQRFLTEARWSETVIGRLQEYLARRLGHPEAVWVLTMARDFPKQGRKSAGVARQYCRQAGQPWPTARVGHVPGLRQPAGPGLDKRLKPKSWTSDQEVLRRVAGRTAELPRQMTELPGRMLERVLELGYLGHEWVAGDDAFGMSPTFREGLAALGMRYVLDVPGGTTVWPWTRLGPVRNIRGSAAPANPSCGLGSGGPWSSAVMNCRMRLGGHNGWSREARGRAPTGSEAQRVRATRRRKPGEERGPSERRNLDGSEIRYYLSNAPEGTTLEFWPTWVGPGGALKRSSSLRRADDGAGRIRRPAAGQGGIPHSHVPAGWSVPAEPAAGLGGKRCPGSRGHRCTGVVREMLPREQFGPDQLLLWLEDTQLRNERARRSHERRRSTPAAKAGWSRHLKPVVVVLGGWPNSSMEFSGVKTWWAAGRVLNSWSACME